MGPKTSSLSALLLLATTLCSHVNASPIAVVNDERSLDNGNLALANPAIVPRRPQGWPYVPERRLSSLQLRSEDDEGTSSDPAFEFLEGRDKKKKSKVSTTSTTSTTEATAKTSPSTKEKQTTTLKTTAKKSKADTSTTEASTKEKSTTTAQPKSTKKSSTTTETSETSTKKTSTETKKTSTEHSSTETKATTTKPTSTKKTSTTEKTTTKKTSKDETSTKTSDKKTTTTTHTTTEKKPGPTVTATVTVGKSTETLTVEPTTVHQPNTSQVSMLSTSIIVPTQTVQPTGPPPPPPPPGKKLKIAIENKITNSTKPVKGYLTGVNPSGQLVMLKTDGTFYVPSTKSKSPVNITADVALPLSSEKATHITLPDYISSARVWFAEGDLQFGEVATSYGVGLVEPTVVNSHDGSENTHWGFMEFTYGEDDGLYANLSFVDFVGIEIGMNMTSHLGPQSAPGLHKNGTQAVCAALKEQAKKDHQPWDKLCEMDKKSGELIRVLSPSSYISLQPDAFKGYFDDYANQVWEKYSSEPLYIETQASAGQVSCQVSGETLKCDGDNRGYAKPSAADVFSCDSGPFAIEQDDNDIHTAVVPRLCAAFNRATLMIPGGNFQPSLLPKNYYPTTPNNFYSKVVHDMEIKGKGYAFPYDDVAPTGNTNVAGLVASTDPKLLTLTLSGNGGL